MKYFKIKNLTNTFEKRNAKTNTVLEVSYVENMTKKTKKIHPDEVLYIELPTLPLSIHKMRINGLVAVSEINKDEFLFEQKKNENKKTDVIKNKPAIKKPTKNTRKTTQKNQKKEEKKEIEFVEKKDEFNYNEE